MKSKICFILLLLFCKFSVFSQDSTLKHGFIQLSINISIPRDYNMRFMQPISTTVIDPVDPIGGYSIYNKLGGALTIEYLKQLKSKLFFKTGLNFTMTSSYKTAKGNETLILYQYNQYHQPVKELYEANYHDIMSGVFIGSEYLLSSKSSIFLNITPDLFHISFSKSIDFGGNKRNDIRLSTNNFFDTIRFKVGYSYQFYKRFKVFISAAFFSDDFTNPYLGIGLKYNFKIR